MTDRRDLVPAELRAAWVDAGATPGVDLRTLFDQQVERHPDKVAVVDDDKSTTYAEVAERIAGLLAGWGIGRGDVVALQLPNIAEACAADLAVAGAGAICLPYPVLYRHNEVRSLLARSGAVACLVARRLRLHRRAPPGSRPAAAPAGGGRRPPRPGPHPRHVGHRGGAEDGAVLPR